MIYEYALEPTLLNNWQNFRYFHEKFGTSRGRLISRYPKKWKKLVYDSLIGCGEIERKRIEEKLASIDKLLFSRRDPIYDTHLDWKINAEIEHSKRSFHAIIAKSNPEKKEYILESDSLSDSFPLWNIPHTKIINRTAGEISDCAKLLIFMSKELILVDPYFAPEKIVYRRTLEAILTTATKGPKGPPSNIEVHLKNGYEQAFFEQQCHRYLPSLIPKLMSVKLFMWKERPDREQIHNRFLLTDAGGIRFGAGLCEGEPGQTDEVELLDETIVLVRRANFSKDTSAYDLVSEIEIQGIS